MSENRITELNKQAWEMRHDDVAQTQALAEETVQFAIGATDRANQARAMRTLSYCYATTGNYKNALFYGHNALEIFKKLDDQSGLAQITRIISRVHWDLGDYASALEFNLRTLRIAQETKDRELQAHTYNNTAMAYARLEDYAKVEEMLNEALHIFQEIGDKRGIVMGYNNLAMTLLSAENYTQALECAQLGYQIVERVQLSDYKVSMLDTLGQIYAKLGQFEAALTHLQDACKLARASGRTRQELYAELNLGRIHVQQGTYCEALRCGATALELAQRLDGEQMLLDCHQLLAKAHKAVGQFEQAFHHHEQLHTLHRAVFALERDDKFTKLEVRYKTEAAQREADIYRQKNQELQHEISERKKVELQLIEAKESADVANRAKSRFIANMNHELRTPLNGILGYTQLLTRDAEPNSVLKEGLDTIYRSGSHLLTLINDILDISKIEAKKVVLESAEIELMPTLESIVSMMRMSAKNKGLQLFSAIDVDLPEVVLGDEKRLRQVLINLLGNAVKFTQKGSITFCVQSLPTNDHTTSCLRFEVIDTGCGIAPDAIESIFRPFEQVEHIESGQTGTGLGLAISKELITAMGSKIHVESQPNSGSRFWFDITCQIGHVEKSAATQHASESVEIPSPRDLHHYISLVDSGDLVTLQHELRSLSKTHENYRPFAAPLLVAANRFDELLVSQQLHAYLGNSSQQVAG